MTPDGARRRGTRPARPALHPHPHKTWPEFTLQLRDGTRLSVPPNRSALDVLLDARPRTPFSCRQGFCGTCRIQVGAGTPEHHDLCLTPAERAAGAMLPCVARRHGDTA
ncbi:2Fe-2S iron-sulfur cluster-binding protein [Streptomyces sp. IBSBF 2806]|uniref:2Fe-2S iron-sulfur cluster-binding protein n=1 Tax=Streptomyces sp. IBSBF 2806 TaxID=2903529 RepID=UPI002FDC30A6